MPKNVGLSSLFKANYENSCNKRLIKIRELKVMLYKHNISTYA